jgi:hypothetical protein
MKEGGGRGKKRRAKTWVKHILDGPGLLLFSYEERGCKRGKEEVCGERERHGKK